MLLLKASKPLQDEENMLPDNDILSGLKTMIGALTPADIMATDVKRLQTDVEALKELKAELEKHQKALAEEFEAERAASKMRYDSLDAQAKLLADELAAAKLREQARPVYNYDFNEYQRNRCGAMTTKGTPCKLTKNCPHH